MKKLYKSSLVALALIPAFASFLTTAESLAITNATVYTATDKGVLQDATVIVEDGKITAINPAQVNADKVVNADGKILTPGYIGSMNQLGLVEVGAVATTRDAADKKADITFDTSLAFNPRSSLIPYTRKGGITTDVVFPRGGDSIFKGQAFVVDLTGSFDSVIATEKAVYVEIGAKRKGSRALELQTLINKLEKSAKPKKSAKDKKKAKELSATEKLLTKIVKGETLLMVRADRASDLLALIKLKQKHNLNMVLVSAGDAILVANELANAKIPVIANPLSDLPGSFESLHNSLGNVSKLVSAGVKVILTVFDSPHNLYQLRYNAGNAVANGLTKQQALATITANVADVFALDAGRIAVGKRADLVLWSADPFDLNSHVETMWISGKEYSTESRQDALRKRYLSNSDKPKMYVK